MAQEWRRSEPDTAISVAIADKNRLVVAGLQRLLEVDRRFQVRATCHDGASFLRLAGDTRFDVGIIGWNLPGVSGRDVLLTLRDRPGAPKLVVYTGAMAAHVPRHVMALGATGFCSKRDSPERLLDIVARVAEGWMIFPQMDVRGLDQGPLDRLTTRERHLLTGLADGATNGQLAKRMGVSQNTVKFHLKNLYEKLDVHNRAGAVAVYMAHAESR